MAIKTTVSLIMRDHRIAFSIPYKENYGKMWGKSRSKCLYKYIEKLMEYVSLDMKQDFQVSAAAWNFEQEIINLLLVLLIHF